MPIVSRPSTTAADLHLSDQLEDDELALSYLYLRDEYGAGKLLIQTEI